MKKIIASILAVLFVLLSPLSAFASTTESMLMYAAAEDEYSVMPLSASDFTVSYAVGGYNAISDSFTLSSYGSVSSVDGLLSNTFNRNLTVSYTDDLFYTFRLKFDDLSVTPGSRLLLSNLQFYIRVPSNVGYILFNSNLNIFNSYVSIDWSGTLRNGTTHFASNASSIESLSSTSLQKSSFSDNNQLFMLDLPMDFDIPEPSQWDNFVDASSGSGNSVYNVRIDSVELTFVIPVSSFSNNNQSILNVISVGDNLRCFFACDNTISKIYLSNYSDTSGLGSLGASLSSSISSLSSSVSSNVQQLKTQITQSTNTITTKIDTMSQDIQTGLQNVVTSAQQNTQNIINTVTQKVDEVKTGITEVKDSILDLPNKIQEMLLGLIVPDSDTMADKYSEFSGLLEEKLGVIYQIPMMLFDFFDTIVNAATTPQTTLTLPAFQLPWIDGSTLTVWQPMEYKIIPEGMQVLSDLIKTITSMTVVVLTFNSVKRAYERFLRS